jgi:hypothetical protein
MAIDTTVWGATPTMRACVDDVGPWESASKRVNQ